MSDVNIWLLILVMGLGTFLLRLSFIQFGDYVDNLPDIASDVLELIPVAVLAALVIPRLFVPDGSGVQVFGNVYLLTGILACIVAWWSRNLLLTIILGMGFFWTIQNVELFLNYVTIIF